MYIFYIFKGLITPRVESETCTEPMEENLPSKRLTNHSARKFLVQRLKDRNVSDTDIILQTGHKSLQSINTYSTMSESKQRSVSEILSGEASTLASSMSCPNPQITTSQPNPQITPSQITPSQHISSNVPCSSQAVLSSSTNLTSKVGENYNSTCIFGGPVYGGTFHITINKTIKRKRIRVIESDSDSQSNSQ